MLITKMSDASVKATIQRKNQVYPLSYFGKDFGKDFGKYRIHNQQ